MIFFATPSPSGGGLLQPSSPLISGMTPPGRKLLPQFCSAYSYRRVNWRQVFKLLNAKNVKRKKQKWGGGGGGLQQPPTILEGEGNIDARNNFVKFLCASNYKTFC